MKSLVFAEESDLYQNIFPDNVYVTYRRDLKDFFEKLDHYLTNNQERLDIVDRAYSHVINNHSWEKRVKTIIEYL